MATASRSDGPDLYRYERVLARRGFTAVAGIDEAGRGACAGPLVVAAVILAPGSHGRIEGLADSKVLSASARDRVYGEVLAKARAHCVVTVSASEVDYLGLHVANLAGMRRALARLNVRPNFAVSDGYGVSGLGIPSLGMWKGDQVCAATAAAGVLAKVTRDRIMAQLHELLPRFGFDAHKGYATAAHREALAKYGPCPQHRRCFAPVRAASHSPVRAANVVSGHY